jgi:hypothetical protein
MRRSNRVRTTIKCVAPWSLLAVCIVNWLWSLTGCWWVELESVGFWGFLPVGRNGTPAYDGWWAHRGVYCDSGCLVIAGNVDFDRCVSGMSQPWDGAIVSVYHGGFTAGMDRPILNYFPWGVHKLRVYPFSCSFNLQQRSFSFGGFDAEWSRDSPGGWAGRRFVTIPWWFLTAVFAIRPLRRAIRPVLLNWHRRRWYRQLDARSHCAGCGYNLCATPQRCPECGRIAISHTASGTIVPVLETLAPDGEARSHNAGA